MSKATTDMQTTLFAGVLTQLTHAMSGQIAAPTLAETTQPMLTYWNADATPAHAAAALALELVNQAAEIATVDDAQERFAQIEARARAIATGFDLALAGRTTLAPVYHLPAAWRDAGA